MKMIKLLAGLSALMFSSNLMAQKPSAEEQLEWYKGAKFGMFIHFDVRGKRETWSPSHLDTAEWARIAKLGGMKYVVPTAHQSSYIIMWDSDVSTRDVTDLTPFKRDIIGELAESCKAAGLRMGCYYALADPINPLYNEPDVGGDIVPYVEYLHSVIKELCEKHQPILIWFDASRRFRHPAEKPFLRQQDMMDMLHSYGTISNSRLGDDDALKYVDYLTMNDNMAPEFNLGMHWESAVTITEKHGAWHFISEDAELKSTEEILHRLVNAAGNGGNLLLNVGPDQNGVIPKSVEERLQTVGDWLEINGEAIYGTEAGPYAHQISWGSITQRKEEGETNLYLNVLEWPKTGKFTLFGLDNKVLEASLLATGEKIGFASEFDANTGQNIITLDIPKNQPDQFVSVIKLVVAGDTVMDQGFLQLTDGKVIMEAYNAKIHDLEPIPNKPTRAIDMKMVTVPLRGEGIMAGRGLSVKGFDKKGQALSWDFKVFEPGLYDVVAICTMGEKIKWDADDRVRATVAGQVVENQLTEYESVETLAKQSESHCIIGTVKIEHPGAHSLTFELTSDFDAAKPSFRGAMLMPTISQDEK
ncbi:MAG: alpha-L-fucosidase [Luteolibacter sp.]